MRAPSNEKGRQECTEGEMTVHTYRSILNKVVEQIRLTNKSRFRRLSFHDLIVEEFFIAKEEIYAHKSK